MFEDRLGVFGCNQQTSSANQFLQVLSTMGCSRPTRPIPHSSLTHPPPYPPPSCFCGSDPAPETAPLRLNSNKGTKSDMEVCQSRVPIMDGEKVSGKQVHGQHFRAPLSTLYSSKERSISPASPSITKYSKFPEPQRCCRCHTMPRACSSVSRGPRRYKGLPL